MAQAQGRGKIGLANGADAPLAATGERLIPTLQHGELVHAEHLARYGLATELAESRRVLDAACGEGYGTGMIASAGARSAIGVDLDEPTIVHARSCYPAAEFVRGEVQQLPFPDGAFDLVVSFETIEHVPNPERALDELRRVTHRDGLLLISTPNKQEYKVENEFHKREFFHVEFVELLRQRFDYIELLLQHNWVTSAILPEALASDASGELDHRTEFRKVVGIEPGSELYTVALCGDAPLPPLRPTAVAASLDEAHQLARRLVEAERTAAMWHRECERAQVAHQEASNQLAGVYDSVWWRVTAPPRRLIELVRRRRDG
jgi:O-antigen biosynthesis protein